jgi:hypothetical protein
MPSLETTNLILAVLAFAVLVQTAMLVGGALWLRSKLATLFSRAEGVDLPALTARANALMDDLHDVAMAAGRTAKEIERTAHGAQAVVHVMGRQVERATGGVRAAFDVVEAVSRRAAALGAGVREGVRELMSARPATADRRDLNGDVPSWVESRRS